MKKIKMYLGGGFHNSKETFFFVSEEAKAEYDDLSNGFISQPEFLQSVLTKSQFNRLDRHFCGIAGCTCGSYTRADITFKD